MSSSYRQNLLRSQLVVGLIVAWCFAISKTSAVILMGTGDPAANTTPPTGDLAGSGWQFEGNFGPFLGTTIAPSFFITAKHVAGSDSVFFLNGTPYPIVRLFSDAFSDLTIGQVTGTFPIVAPLYSSGAETGQRLVAIGRGTQRGSEIFLGGTLRGWHWGTGDGVQRWGENYVSAIVHGGPANAYVYATFDSNGSPNESHLSSGDSGGALFIQETGIWKLAGINYAVDDLYTDAAGNGQFVAAVFDARGFYTQDSTNPPHYTQITGARPQPTGFYSPQISSKLAWIYSVIAAAGDANGNGVSNHLDYARDLNLPEPAGPGAPSVTIEGGFLTLTYRKLTTINNLLYTIRKSANLVNWMPVNPDETVLTSGDDIQTIKAKVSITGPRMFLRLEILEVVP